MMASTEQEQQEQHQQSSLPNPYFLEALERLTLASANSESHENADGDARLEYEIDAQESNNSDEEVASQRSPETPATQCSMRSRKSRISIEEREVTNPHGAAWKEFEHDSEAGRMLRKLYAGGRHNAPLASYPKFRSKSRELKPNSWFMGKPLVDPRERTDRRDREQRVQAPRPKRTVSKPMPAILSVPKRKPLDRIEEDQRRIEEDRAVERPRPCKAISTETEKRRLAMHFQFKGGKALPETGTIAPIQGNIPLSLISGKPTKSVLRRSQREKAEAEFNARRQHREQLEQDFEQVHEEVQVLKAQIENVEGSNSSARLLAHIRSELRQRLSELENIDSLLREEKDTAADLALLDSQTATVAQHGVMEDLLAGMNDWRNIQDVVRKTFKSLHDVVRAQGEKIRQLEQKAANAPTGGEFENLQVSMANKPTFAELNKHLTVRFEEMGLPALRAQLGSKADKIEMKDLYADMTTATQRMAESNNALELLVRQQQDEIETLKRQVRGLSNIQSQEEDLHTKFATRKWVEEILDFETEARKQALTNVRKELADRAAVLEKRISSLPTVEDLDEVLSQKVDMDTLARAVRERPTHDEMAKEIQNKSTEAIVTVQEQNRTQLREAVELALARTKTELERLEDSMVDMVSRSELLEVCGPKVGGSELEERLQEVTDSLGEQFKETLVEVQRELIQVINKKAFKADVQRQLATKPNADDVQTWLSSKVELADVRDALAHKADLTALQAVADRLGPAGKRNAKRGGASPPSSRDKSLRAGLDGSSSDLEGRYHREDESEEERDFDDASGDGDQDEYFDGDFDGGDDAAAARWAVSRLTRRLAKMDADKVSVKDLCLLLDQKANIKDVNEALAQLSEQQAQAATQPSQIADAEPSDPSETPRQLRRDINELANAISAELSVGRWIWSSGRVLSDRAVPWNIECVNTATDNLQWSKDSSDVTAIVPGLYELHIGFFAETDPEVQVLVNGEPILYTASRPRDKRGVKPAGAAQALMRRAKHSAGNVTGWTMSDFVALPARARLSITYDGDPGAQGFLSLRKL
ncbi:Hypothetical Protein FCC1311_075432 [Hondaea fermentalgiana]|uniref:Uncharacterized protein n=1 Tax=Hondaea fermentalgiana TaxID=2315210 RepID=A0A2R5GKB6_9STRA|nr:Hypothetical Protein FCC1311_075432 [Hondaea fermentalgiana]|eukprot:GBG31320.1 Hypothetical Protein FCC1311_075432 [Hondaea fermentalgiana]